MLFDFTPETKLSPVWNRRYAALRVALCAVFLAGAFCLSFRVLFPSQTFVFSFANPGAKSNTIFQVKDESGILPEKGKLVSEKKLFWNVYFSKLFPRASVRLTVDKEKYSLKGSRVILRKSYHSFSYPLDESPLKFPNGTFLKNNENYYIVSREKLRKFSSLSTVRALDFKPESFLEAEDNEIKNTSFGEIISDTKNYPEDSLFAIDNAYYQLKNNTLVPFISQSAFLTLYDQKQAVEKNEDFLKNFPLSDEILGFADGTLLSYADAVYAVSGGKIRPFDNSETFLALGFDWSDVIAASAPEVGMYEKGKPLTLSDPHPDGTVFSDKSNDSLFVIQDERKKLLAGKAAIRTYLKKNPVSADSAGLETKIECRLEKKWRIIGNYECVLLIEDLFQFAGNEYRFSLDPETDAQVKKISVIFFQDASWTNLKKTLAILKRNILINYGYEYP